MGSELRQVLRRVHQQPGFSAVVVLTLALGIGAAVTMFGVADAALFRPLPYRDPDRLVDIVHIESWGTAEQAIVSGMSWEQLANWRSQAQIFEGIEAYGGTTSWKHAADESRVQVGYLSPGMLALLGIAPRLGRGFARDASEPGNDRVLLLSEGFWKRAFGGDPAAIGRTLAFEKGSYTIIGVLPAAFRFPFGDEVDAWRPVAGRDPGERGPAGRYTSIVARLRPGLSLDAAQRAANGVVERWQRETPPARPWQVGVSPLGAIRGVAGTRPALLALLGAVGFFLLIACANVGNMLLVRGLARQREIAVRTALGARRGRIVGLLVLEATVLSALGGAGAAVLAAWAVRVIPAITPPSLSRTLFDIHPPTLDGRVLAFGVAATFIAAVACSVGPAVRASASIRLPSSGGRVLGLTVEQRRWRAGLQAVQIALALVLLSSAGLMVNSFVRMATVDAGFDTRNLAYVDVVLSNGYADRAAQDAFFDEWLARVRALPGVRAAALGDPPSGDGGGTFIVEGSQTPAREGPRPVVSLYAVGDDYFQTVGIPIGAGRGFDGGDRPGAVPVAIVDEATARRYWPGENPIGKRFRYSPWVPWITIVGVVPAVKTSAFASKSGTTQAYFPLAQEKEAARRCLLLRTTADPMAVATLSAGLVRSIDARLSARRVGLVADLYDASLVEPRFSMVLVGSLAGLALAMTAVGLYGLLSFAVTQRTSEIGVRIALGADVARLRALVMGEALVPVAGGVAAGLAGAWSLTRLLDAWLYGVTPHDPATFAAIVAVMLGTAAVAAAAPVRRATRIDAVAALRAE